LIEALSLLVIFLIDRERSGFNTNSFIHEYILTKPFAKDPVQGKVHVGVLRDDSLSWKYFLKADSLLGYRIAQNVTAFTPAGNLYITDTNGFIVDTASDPIRVIKQPNTKRIIVLGGSTVMGAGAPHPSENLIGALTRISSAEVPVERVERRIKYEFINAGVGGYQSSQEYLYLVSSLMKFSPDLVIVYNGWNDSVYLNSFLKYFDKNASSFYTATHFNNTLRLNESYRTGGSIKIFLAVLGNELVATAKSLGTFELLRRAYRFVTRNAAGSEFRLENNYPEYDKKSIILYEQNLRLIADFLGSKGVPVVFFLQPLAWVDGHQLTDLESQRVRGETIEKSNRLKFYNDATVLFKRLGDSYDPKKVCFRDISKTFQNVYESIYVDSGHLLPNGNLIVAKRIMAELDKCGL
jgi:hypothetical protein